MRFTHHPARGVVEIEHTRGRRLDSHLVFDTAARHAIARPEATISRGDELRHDEERDALGATGSIRQFGQHQMHDVLGEIVLTRRNEDFLAGDAIRAILGGNRPWGDDAQIGTRLRLGETHGAAPRAVDELGQEALFELLRSMAHERAVRPV